MNRAAIILTNDNIDAVLIKQLCDRDITILELRYKGTRILAASMYMDINEEIDNKKKYEILQFSKGSSILIDMDSNSRYTGWHDSQTEEVKS
jgi:hypothetical protein